MTLNERLKEFSYNFPNFETSYVSLQLEVSELIVCYSYMIIS